MRIFARVEYDGSSFSGWQVQPGEKTVQGELNRVLSIVTQSEVSVVGAGRTDTGVHGRGQGFHFDVDTINDLTVCERGANSLLPSSISIYDIREVTEDFHARFSAVERTYHYYICTRKMPLSSRCATHVYSPLDWEKIAVELQSLKGNHSFSSFCASGCYTDNHNCMVTEASLKHVADGVYCIRLSANRFVYRMVRSIVGTLIDMGRGKISRSLVDILSDQNRSSAGTTAPAGGLVLEYVRYYEFS